MKNTKANEGLRKTALAAVNKFRHGDASEFPALRKLMRTAKMIDDWEFFYPK